MNTIIARKRLSTLSICALAPALLIAACSEPAVDETDTVASAEMAATPAQNATAKPAGSATSTSADTTNEGPEKFAATFPAALLGKWRATSGPAPTAAQCDGNLTENMGELLQVRVDGYAIFEEGGRFIDVKEREAGRIRAVFDTTYADTPTQDELTFAVDPVAKTLTVTNHDAGEAGSRTFKRCPA